MEELERFARVVTWLDDARWAAGGLGEEWEAPTVKGLTSSQKVLAHWVTYVTDMQMPAGTVWRNGFPVFGKVIADYDYDEAAPHAKVLPKYYQMPTPSSKVPTLIVASPPREHKYTPRYKWQYEEIERTLKLLRDYGRSLVEFMKSLVQRYSNQPEALRRLAHALYVLTYARYFSEERARHILAPDNKTELETDFQRWNCTTTKGGQKRLWAALRDYLKHKEIRRCVEETFVWPSQYFELSQLELPGDIWNDRFTVKLLYSLAERAHIRAQTARGKPLNSPTLARQIYKTIKRNDPGTPFYPEQMDVSVDITSRMCARGHCDMCVFGKNEVMQFCSQPGPAKLCPVLMIMCGYEQDCVVENCPVITGTGALLCKSGEETR